MGARERSSRDEIPTPGLMLDLDALAAGVTCATVGEAEAVVAAIAADPGDG